MATANYGGAQGSTFRWKIENAVHWWGWKGGRGISSPVFTSDALGRTKWSLWFSTTDKQNESNVCIEIQREYNCSGPDIIETTCQVALLGKDHSILKELTASKCAFSKGSRCGFLDFERRETVFVTDRERFLPEDTLTVQCTVWTTDRKPDNLKKCTATTVIKVKRRNFVWKIDNLGDFQTDKRNKFMDYLFDCDLTLHKKSDRLSVVLSELDGSITYVSCTVSLIDSDDRKQICGIQKYFTDDLQNVPLHYTLSIFSNKLMNKGRYFPHDVLCLDFEHVFVTVEGFYDRENPALLENGSIISETSERTEHQAEDTFDREVPNNGKVLTATGTLPVRKEILIANSPVFEIMFSQDSRQIEIPDFDYDTVHKMVALMYSNSLQDEELESLLKLYKIATEYRILSLKNQCYSQFRNKLDLTNVCDVLVKADEHNVIDLKRAVEDYVLRNSKEIFCSDEWVNLMKTEKLKLAANVMYKKITKRDFNIPLET